MHPRTRIVFANGLSAGNVTSWVDTMNAQSWRWENNEVSSGAMIERCKCRSGSSINNSVLAGAVRTFAVISKALRSPSDNSAIL